MLKELFSVVTEIFSSNEPFSTFFNKIIAFINNEIIVLLNEVWSFPLYVTSDHHKILVKNVLFSVFLFFFGIKFAKKLAFKASKRLPAKFDQNTVSLFRQILYYLFLLCTTIIVLDISNVPLTALAVLGTTFAVGIGIGSQHLANNFMSGIIIMFEQPVKLGDIIEVKNIIGKVTNIGSRCVSVKTDEDIDVLIPNSSLLQDILVNWTHENSKIMSSVDITIEKSKSMEEIEAFLNKIFISNKEILKKPSHKILLKNYTADMFVFEIEFWIDLIKQSKAKYAIDKVIRSIVQQSSLDDIKVINIDNFNVGHVINDKSK